MWIALPFLVCIVGGCMYCFIDPVRHPHAPTLGLHMFWVGLFVFLLGFHGIPSGIGISTR